MTRIDEARETLARAEAEQREADRQGLSDRLLHVREDLRIARARYRELSVALRQEIEFRSAMHARITQAYENIDVSLRQMPRGAEHTPDDPEVMDWLEQHAALIEHREALTAELAAYIETPRIELARLESVGGIMSLEYAEQNLVRQLEPQSSAEEWKQGGVYRVG